MTIVKRTGLGRPMTWSELDDNWDQLQESTTAAQQSAALAAASQSAAATSESNAAASAAEASSQASAAGTLRSDLSSTETGKGLSLSVAEDGSTGQQFYDSADQFAGDYGTAIITISSVNRWITYNGERWYVKPGTTVPFTTTGLNATSWAVDSAKFIEIGDATIRSEIASSGGFSNIGQVRSFAALRLLTPEYAGQRILLSAWNEDITPYGQSSFGGGEFVSVSGSAVDDGGFIAKVSDTWYWKRVKNEGDATVLDFGAIPNGETDSITAAVSMFNWSQSNNNLIGIVYPAGSFAVSSYDFSVNQIWNFRLVGSPSEFGYFASTTLNLIGDEGSVAFKVKARYMDVGNFTIRNGLSKDTVSRGFYKNTITAGQYNRIKCIYADTLYGKVFDMQDTLDTKIDQLYSQYCTKNILSVIMSGDSNGSWDHSTAIELSNVNIQHHAATSEDDCALFMPRCTQSIMRNVWIERSSYPGNISEGSWTINTLCMEDNSQPMYGQWLRVVNSVTDYQGTNSGIDFDAGEIGDYNGVTRPDWVTSRSEQGKVLIETSGVSIDGYLAYKFNNSLYRMSNATGSPSWVRLGIFDQSNTGDSARLTLIGCRGWDASVQNPTANSSNFGGGVAYIDVQSTDSMDKNSISWYGEGSVPIYDVKFERTYLNQYIIYIQLAPWVGSCALFFEISGTGRNQQGTPTTFVPDLSTISDITTVDNIQSAFSNVVFGNGTYGFGMNVTTGQLTFTGPDAALTKIPIIINGNQKYIAVTDS